MVQQFETLDITLLQNNKNEFIIRCQRIISIIIKQYILKGMFAESDFEDIKQNVTIKLINRLPLIEKNYNGKALMVTYVNVVIDNICLRIHEEEKSPVAIKSLEDYRMLTEKNVDNTVWHHEHVPKDILIMEEVERFALALNLFYVRRFKILVFLKVYFFIPVTSEELKGCFRGITNSDLERIKDVFEKEHQTAAEFANFGLLTKMLNKYEKKSTPEESLRRSTHQYIEKLIRLMNGNPPNRAHTKDSLKFLLERYSESQTYDS